MVEPRSAMQLQILRDYAAGKIGTRDNIERAGFDDYGDLIVALAHAGLDLPKPVSSPEREARIAAILQPLLQQLSASRSW